MSDIAQHRPRPSAVDIAAWVLMGIALFLPLIRTELGLSFTQAGMLAAASTVVYAAMQIPSGFLTDRVGARRLFVVGALGTTVLVVSFARLHHYGALLANQALAVEWLVGHHAELSPQVYPVPADIDHEVARLKLRAMGVDIDTLSAEQEEYLRSWEQGT